MELFRGLPVERRRGATGSLATELFSAVLAVLAVRAVLAAVNVVPSAPPGQAAPTVAVRADLFSTVCVVLGTMLVLPLTPPGQAASTVAMPSAMGAPSVLPLSFLRALGLLVSVSVAVLRPVSVAVPAPAVGIAGVPAVKG